MIVAGSVAFPYSPFDPGVGQYSTFTDEAPMTHPSKHCGGGV